MMQADTGQLEVESCTEMAAANQAPDNPAPGPRRIEPTQVASTQLPVLLRPQHRRAHGLQEFLERIPAQARSAYDVAKQAGADLSAAERQQMWRQHYPVSAACF